MITLTTERRGGARKLLRTHIPESRMRQTARSILTHSTAVRYQARDSKTKHLSSSCIYARPIVTRVLHTHLGTRALCSSSATVRSRISPGGGSAVAAASAPLTVHRRPRKPPSRIRHPVEWAPPVVRIRYTRSIATLSQNYNHPTSTKPKNVSV